MITCDQVVSGGSAERTTKMAAAPAADSLSILLLAHQPFSLVSSYHLSAFLSFFFSVFLLPLITRYFLSLGGGSALLILLRIFRLRLTHPYRVSRPVPREDSDVGERLAGRGKRLAGQDQLMLMSSRISPIIVDH